MQAWRQRTIPSSLFIILLFTCVSNTPFPTATATPSPLQNGPQFHEVEGVVRVRYLIIGLRETNACLIIKPQSVTVCTWNPPNSKNIEGFNKANITGQGTPKRNHCIFNIFI